jgi:hypothetical protein
MLISFLNIFLSDTAELIYDSHDKICYLLIYKNGTRSLVNLLEKDNKRYHQYVGNNPSEFLKLHNVSVVTVFIREPITRFISGLNTQVKLYGIDPKKLIDYTNEVNSINLFDVHIVPQFWFFLRLRNCCPDIKFKITPFSEISKIVDVHINPSDKTIPISMDKFNIQVQDKINYHCTEDIVLYYQFMNTTSTVEQIIEKIKLEKDFINNLKDYSWYPDIYFSNNLS